MRGETPLPLGKTWRLGPYGDPGEVHYVGRSNGLYYLLTELPGTTDRNDRIYCETPTPGGLPLLKRKWL